MSPSEVDGDHHFGFNGGAVINMTDNHHILMSMGTDLDGPTNFFYYFAYQLTFDPEKEKEKGPPEAHAVGRMLNFVRYGKAGMRNDE